MLAFIQNYKYSVVGLSILAVMFSGCDRGTSGGMGTMEVRLHDAPARYDAVNVFIERVEVNKADDPDGWVTISEPQQTYNLLELANGAYEVLGEAELDAGFYPQIRLILSNEGHSVVVDGQEYDMFVPSGAQTGIKLNVNAEIEEDTRYVLLLDFDASRSVVETGQSQNPDYLLKPVITASNEAVTGSIDGTVTPAETRPVVYAIADSDTLSTTYADTTSGYFKLIGLEAGTYTVSINPTNANYQPKDTTSVEVTAGETTELGTIEIVQ